MTLLPKTACHISIYSLSSAFGFQGLIPKRHATSFWSSFPSQIRAFSFRFSLFFTRLYYASFFLVLFVPFSFVFLYFSIQKLTFDGPYNIFRLFLLFSISGCSCNLSVVSFSYCIYILHRYLVGILIFSLPFRLVYFTFSVILWIE